MGKNAKSKEKNTFLDDLPVLILSLVLTLLPIIMFPYSEDMYALPKVTFLYVATLLLAIVFITLSIRNGEFVIRRTPLDIPVLLIVIYATISLLLSDGPLLGLIGKYKRYEGLPSLICFALIYFFTVQSIKGEKNLERMVKIMAAGFALVSFYGFLQLFGLDFPTVLHFEARVQSSFGNPILFGSYLVIMLPLLFILARNSDEQRWRLFSWSLIAIGSINLIYTESRGAWLGMVAVVMAIVIKSRKQSGVKNKRTKKARRKTQTSKSLTSKNRFAVVVVTITVCIVVIGSLFAAPNSHLGQRLVSTFAFSEGSAATRLEIWKASFKMVSDKPLFGYGLEQMGYWFPLYKTAQHVSLAPNGIADRTHNDLLQAAVDMGLPGLLLYMWMFVIAVLGLFRNRSTMRETPYSTGLFAALTGYFAQSQTGIPAVFISPLVWSMLGASVTIRYQTKETRLVVPKWLQLKAIIPVAIALFVAFSLLAIRPIVADIYLFKAEQLARVSPDQAEPLFEALTTIYPYQTEYPKRATEFYLDFAASSQNEIFARRASLIAEQGLDYNKRDFELAYYVGESSLLDYRLSQDQMALTRAEKYYKLAQKLWPSLPLIKSKLFDVATLKGDSKEAATIAQQLIDMDQQDPRFYYALATYAQKIGDQVAANQYFKKVEEIAPGFLLKTSGN
ncbi:MAG: O-antigen ligase family protein [Candidatus Aquicultor sp.]